MTVFKSDNPFTVAPAIQQAREAYESVCAEFRNVLQETLDLHEHCGSEADRVRIPEALCDLASSWLTLDRHGLHQEWQESDCQVEALIADRRVARAIDLLETMIGRRWGEPRELVVVKMRLLNLKAELQDLVSKLKTVEFERSRAALLARSVVH